MDIMQKPRALFSKIRQFIRRFKRYNEFGLYVLALFGLWCWQWYLYGSTLRAYQDIIIATFGLQTLNLGLSLALLRKARLLAQFLILSAIIFGCLVVYYLTVIVANVV